MSSDSGSDSDETNVLNHFKKGMGKFTYKPPEKNSPVEINNDSDNEIVSPPVKENSRSPSKRCIEKNKEVKKPSPSKTTCESGTTNSAASILDIILNKNSPHERKLRRTSRNRNVVAVSPPVQQEMVTTNSIIEIPKPAQKYESIEDKLKSLSEKCEELMDVSNKTVGKRKAKRKRLTKNKKVFKEIHELSTDEEDIKIEDDVNPIVQVNLLWRSVHRKSFKVLKYDMLESIVEYLTKTYDLNPKLLLFTIDEKEVDLTNNSYASLRLTEKSLVEGGILPDSYLEREEFILNNEDRNRKRGIKFKAQLNSKKYFDVFIQRDDTMEVLFSQVSHEAKLRIDKFKILHDGQRVKFNDTFHSLGLEEGDVFDIVPIL